MENVAREEGLALKHLFPYKSSCFFFKIQTVIKSPSFKPGGHQTGRFNIFDNLFHFWHS